VPLLIVALAVGAVAASLAAEWYMSTGGDIVWLALPGLGLALTAGAYFHVEYRYGEDEVDALDLFEAALAPTVLALPPVAAVALVCGTKALAEALLGVAPVKAAFNVASWGAAAAGATLVLAVSGVATPATSLPLLALVGAMVVVLVVNNASFVAVLCLSERRSAQVSLHQLHPALFPAWVVGAAASLGFALIFAAAYVGEPLTAWLLVVPLLGLYGAARGYARGRADLARVRGLHRATTALSRATDLEQGIDTFLYDVRKTFNARAAALITVDGHQVSTRRAELEPGDQTPPDPTTAVGRWMTELPAAVLVADPGHPVVGAHLAAGGWREVLAAPVRTATDLFGALALYDRGGVVVPEAADLTYLEALSREVASTVERIDAQRALHRSEARFRALVRHSSELVVVVDRDGIVGEVVSSRGPAHATVFARCVGRPAVELAHPDDRERLADLLDAVIARPGTAATATWRVRTSDGTWRHLETVADNLLNDPAVSGVVLNSRDVTERERATALVAGHATVLGAIAQQRPLADAVTAVGQTVAAELAAVGFTVALVDGSRDVTSVLGTELPRKLVDEILDDVEAGMGDTSGHLAGTGLVVVADHPDPAPWRQWALETGIDALWVAPLHAPDGSTHLGAVIVLFSDARDPESGDRSVLDAAVQLTQIAVERSSAQAQLLHEATHDALTSLPNRRLFLDRSAQALRRLERTRRSVAVLFVDLDRFKAINDSLGHDAGDRLLNLLADRLGRVMRPSDTLARFGGDEFTILCEDLHGTDEAIAIAERIRQALAEPVTLDGHRITVTASIGIAHTDDPRCAPLELVENADAAMYRSKHSGGNRQELFRSSMRQEARQALATVQGLREAVASRQLEVHYQPIIDLTSGRITGAEALVRWNHPVHGIMRPAYFIPLAEETGLIEPIGTLVLHEACRQATRWRAVLGDDFTMSVNVSARQLVSDDFSQTVRSALRQAGTPPSSIQLELTETGLMESSPHTIATLHELTDLGVRLAIDDFGTGYSSLTYLKRFPIHVIKVDRSFVSGLGEDADDHAIVAAVVDLAHELGFASVAEGVETNEQLEVLQRLGCDEAQGYYFSPPVPAGEFRSEPYELPV
jgi:diguanylate cyclase (GGDEF)-like protein/PAS domain S-box-containing protein